MNLTRYSEWLGTGLMICCHPSSNLRDHSKNSFLLAYPCLKPRVSLLLVVVELMDLMTGKAFKSWLHFQMFAQSST